MHYLHRGVEPLQTHLHFCPSSGEAMFLPYKVDVPMARWPVANFVLIGLTVLISIAMFGPLKEWSESFGTRDLPPGVVEELHKAGIDLSAGQYPAVVDFFLLQPG